jgi:hypothetical protein
VVDWLAHQILAHDFLGLQWLEELVGNWGWAVCS